MKRTEVKKVNRQKPVLREKPELINEVMVLKDLGLKDYEIRYLLHLKIKENASKKWEQSQALD